MTDGDPHADQPVVTAGAPASVADAVVVLLHGRGATAQGVVNLAEPLYRHGVTFVAPDAARSRWYPYSSFAPVERNEPHVSSALAAVDRVLADVHEWDVAIEDVVLFGFSQGAFLASEYAARNPRRYGGVAALSGGLLGETVDASGYTGSLDGAPVFLGVGDDDPNVPVERVHETREVFEALDGTVTERVYEGVGHEVTDDEFAVVGSWLDGIVGETD
ncbi:alpha/beta hydrolase fold protein [Halobacterium hubeiense]|uniref:Alpha/beta hydrolase fold protein n=1 Tax=Halobacterium hubeiense TaxID=1407499 RepID=A0A0U5CWN2_9EURY|nr:alpha/beta fold hydrolase [Halobacterium hubeiense]CQH51228.1 alpha/beta hydrolase fold protein [Halobacterium hubeiense]